MAKDGGLKAAAYTTTGLWPAARSRARPHGRWLVGECGLGPAPSPCVAPSSSGECVTCTGTCGGSPPSPSSQAVEANCGSGPRPCLSCDVSTPFAGRGTASTLLAIDGVAREPPALRLGGEGVPALPNGQLAHRPTAAPCAGGGARAAGRAMPVGSAAAEPAATGGVATTARARWRQAAASEATGEAAGEAAGERAGESAGEKGYGSL